MAYPRFTVSAEKHKADAEEGVVFRCDVFSETVADDGLVNCFIRTKAQGVALAVQVEAGGLSMLRVTEAATMENAGTNLSLFNQNRISQRTATMSVSHANSVSNGTIVYADVIGTAVIGNAIGAGENRPNHLILAGSEHYNVSVQNLSGGAIEVCLSLNFTAVT